MLKREETDRIAAEAAAEQPKGEDVIKVKSLIGPDVGHAIRLPYSAAQNAVMSGTAERIPGEFYPPAFPGAPAVMATEGAVLTPEAAAEDVAGTVADAQGRIAAADTIEALDALEQAEKDGKGRKGVLEAVAKRRAELDATFGTVAEVRERVATIATAEELAAAETRERTGKARKGVLDAIAARRAELAAPPAEPTPEE